jgi:aspartate-semialdehyde dehydrogenase
MSIPLSKVKFAVVGATGVVGRKILTVLSEYGIPVKNVSAIASKKSKGREISYGDDDIVKAIPLDDFDFSNVQIAFFSAGSKVSKLYAEKATSKGCIVIDNTSHFRMDNDVPLIIPEINSHEIKNMKKNIISNPNCSTTQLAMALKPIHEINKVSRVIASTYQSVSGAGHEAMQELMDSSKAIFMGKENKSSTFTKPITFNAIPHIDSFLENGETKEEWKMRVEIQKLIDPKIELSATCVRLPIFIGHSISTYVECESDVNIDKIYKALEKFDGIRVVDDISKNEYITPIESQNMDDVYVSRVRADPHNKKAFWMWVVSDNLRKGASLNSVQIAEAICEDYSSLIK